MCSIAADRPVLNVPEGKIIFDLVMFMTPECTAPSATLHTKTDTTPDNGIKERRASESNFLTVF